MFIVFVFQRSSVETIIFGGVKACQNICLWSTVDRPKNSTVVLLLGFGTYRMCRVLAVAVANYGYSERNSALRTPNAVGGPAKGVMLCFWKYILGCPEFEVFRVP
jgi:hypothetical protein